MDSTKDNVAIIATNAEQLIEQLDALRPSKHQQKTVLFQKLYPAIERALAREVPQKAITAQLKKMELHFSMGGFRSMLEAERKLRAEKGECLRCEHCGSNLHAQKGPDEQPIRAAGKPIEK